MAHGSTGHPLDEKRASPGYLRRRTHAWINEPSITEKLLESNAESATPSSVFSTGVLIGMWKVMGTLALSVAG